MKAVISKLTDERAMAIISQVEDVFKNAPHLPKGLVDFLVKISPWLAGIFGVMGLFGALTTLSFGLGLTGLFLWMRQMPAVATSFFFVMAIFQIMSALLLLMAFRPLQERNLTGWVLLYWNVVLGALMSAIGLLFGYQNLVQAVLSLLISFYVLFEMKPHYGGVVGE